MTDNEKEIVATIKLSLLRAIVDLNEETLAMAIKVPKSEEPSEDCVSRQAVLERINDWWGITSTSGEPTVCDYIRELPPVTPTQKVGHWIDSEILGEFKCSCCGNYWQDAEENEYEDWVNIAKYCPNCGAEMESE